MMNKTFRSILSRTALFAFLLVCLWVLYLLSKAEYQNGGMSHSAYVGALTLIIYFGLVFITGVLSPIRFFAQVNGFLFVPLLLYRHFISPFAMSLIRVYIGVIFVYVVLVSIQLKLLPLLGLHLEDATRLYFSLTATIIIYSIFGNIISYYTSKLLFLWSAKEYERYSIIFDQNKFSYLIYVLAFVCLVGFTFSEFNNVEMVGSMLTLKKVLLPTFATFVAWDRLISKSNLFKFDGVRDLLLSEFQEKIHPMIEAEKDKEKKVEV